MPRRYGVHAPAHAFWFPLGASPQGSPSPHFPPSLPQEHGILLSIASLGRTLRRVVARGRRGALEKAAWAVALRTEAVMRRHCGMLSQVRAPTAGPSPSTGARHPPPRPVAPRGTVWELRGPDASLGVGVGGRRAPWARADRPVPDSGAGGPRRALPGVAAAGGGSSCAPWTPSPPAGRNSSRCGRRPPGVPSASCAGPGAAGGAAGPGLELRLGPSAVSPSGWPRAGSRPLPRRGPRSSEGPRPGDAAPGARPGLNKLLALRSGRLPFARRPPRICDRAGVGAGGGAAPAAEPARAPHLREDRGAALPAVGSRGRSGRRAVAPGGGRGGGGGL